MLGPARYAADLAALTAETLAAVRGDDGGASCEQPDQQRSYPMPLTDEQQALVTADAERLGFVLQDDGSYVWPKFPMWRLEAMSQDEADEMIAIRGGIRQRRVSELPVWVGEHAEADMTSQRPSRNNLQIFKGPLIVGRRVGGTENPLAEITDVIAYIESEWDTQRAQTAAAMRAVR